MTEYILKVHPLSAKILLSDFAVANSDDQVFIPASDQHSTVLASQMRRSTVGLDMDIKILSPIPSLSIHAGANLYHYHKRKIFDYILANIDIEGNAKQSIRTFYAIYDIDDDDYDEESMYREWTRYYGMIKAKTSYHTVSGVRRTVVISNRRGCGQDVAAIVIKEHTHLFYNTKGVFSKPMLHQLLTYASIHIDGKEPNVSISTRYDRLYKWRSVMHRHPSIKKTIDRLVAI